MEYSPLPKTKRGKFFILVLIAHLSRWAEPIAVKRTEVKDVVLVLRSIRMPRHGVPVTLLSDNEPQFVASAVCHVSKGAGARKIYSTPYHLQGNSVCESFMRSLKKNLAALVSEDERNGAYFLSAVVSIQFYSACCYGVFSLFLMYGREAVLPVQRLLDELRLDLESRRWPSRLWKARLIFYDRHAVHAANYRKWVEKCDALLPVGTIVSVKLDS